jgi:hypothetical protein
MNPWKDARWKVVAWGVTVVLGAGLLVLLLRLLLAGKRGPVSDGGVLTKAVNTARHNIAEANALAAVKVAAAHTQEKDVHVEMGSIAVDLDDDRRLSRLVSLRKRLTRP